MGSAFVLLLNPIFWGLTTLYVVTQWSAIEEVFPSIVFYASSLLLFVGNFVFIYLNVAGSLQRGEFGLTRTAMLSPMYWGLMSYAAWKGFMQLFTNPFYWERPSTGWTPGEGSRPSPRRPPPPPVRRARGARPRAPDHRGAVHRQASRSTSSRGPWESLAVFAGFAGRVVPRRRLAGGALHVVGFQTLYRVRPRLTAFHDEPPKLSAVVFESPTPAALPPPPSRWGRSRPAPWSWCR